MKTDNPQPARDHPYGDLLGRGLACIFVVSLILLALVAAPAMAQKDRLNYFATGTRVLANATLQQVIDQYDDGFRLIDLEVRSGSPLRFDASFVDRPGASYFYYGITDPGETITLAQQNNARPVDIEQYDVGDETRWAVVMDGPSGPYYLHVNFSFASLQTWANDNPGWRMIDIERSPQGTFDSIFYRNSGADAAQWGWLVGVSGQQVLDFAENTGSMVIDAEQSGVDTYDAIFAIPGGDPNWAILSGLDVNEFSSYALQDEFRIIDIEYFHGNGTYMITLLENGLLFRDDFETGDLTLWGAN